MDTAAVPMKMWMEVRLVDIDINVSSCPLIVFQTFLVSGGSGPSISYLSSTELLVETGSAWVLTGELPSPRYVLSGANIDNKVLMTGN